MNWAQWLPWKAVARRMARRHGFLDPITFLGRLREFARPSEVGEPIELLRAGAAFHARGLINRAIQFNLDWVWPYWVERQFNPADESFVPRAFSFSHVNLTHRNWTAVGLPNIAQYPIVDPRGLVTPLFDGWSLDFWLVARDGRKLIPSKLAAAEQSLETGDRLAVHTRVASGELALESVVSMEWSADRPECVVHLAAHAPPDTQLIVALRPYNPEGISFIDTVEPLPNQPGWMVNGNRVVRFSGAPARTALACYASGDVFASLNATGTASDAIKCGAGMASAAAVFPATARVEVRVPLDREPTVQAPTTWRKELETCSRLEVPDERLQQLYDGAVTTLLLHAPHEIYPGPYTYKRFWYRDAALILNALLAIGAHDRARRALELFPRGQLADGYFRSQEGEWDANGEVLWIVDRYFAVTGEQASQAWLDTVELGAHWIVKKRMGAGSPHPGLFPAGFSAEHLGPNDFYYWDDFWGVAGLRAAARMLRASKPQVADEYDRVANEFLDTIIRSIPVDRTNGAIPAAPDRRMDSGAIGSLVADYPLQLLGAGDARLLKTAQWLMEHSFYRGGFFQNMIHSGINAYLTLDVAQTLLRAGDPRARDLMTAVAGLASSTGQWPEAIHPRTLGGCMGDGQHVWAAAEWVMMMHNFFVREEGDGLVVGPGIFPGLRAHAALHHAHTRHGAVSVKIRPGKNGQTTVEWTSKGLPARIEFDAAGCDVIERAGNSVTVRPTA